MRESTRFYTRAATSGLVAGVSLLSYFRLGDGLSLVFGLFFAVAAAFWFANGRSAGDALAPPLTNPRLVKRLVMVCGSAGAILLVTMLWRVRGEWTRLIEQGNLWLALGWIILLGIAAFAPIELRRPNSRRV